MNSGNWCGKKSGGWKTLLVKRPSGGSYRGGSLYVEQRTRSGAHRAGCIGDCTRCNEPACQFRGEKFPRTAAEVDGSSEGSEDE